MSRGQCALSLFAGEGETRALLRATDWAATPLGPVDSWSDELVAAVRTVLPSRIPMLLWWGPELVQLYNEAYTPVLGDKHPAAMGQPARLCWAEVWDVLEPMVRGVLDGDGATFSENQKLLLRRHGYVEETYWTFSYSPVQTADGTVAGVFVATTDATGRVLGTRRMRTLRRLGSLSVADAADDADACRAALAILAGNRSDVPFAVTFLCDEGGEPREVASFGVDDTGPPREARAVLHRVLATGRPEPLAGDRALALPLTAGGHSAPVGLLVLGVSPYRALDEEYRTFFGLVARQTSTALADARALSGERRRAQALAELDAAKTRFFQNVSHEFRTPLTLLLGPLETLLAEHADRLPADQVQAVGAAHRAALRLRRLVDTLLTLARAEAGELHTRPEPTDLTALTADCVAMFRSAAERAGLRLDTALEVHRPVVVDRDMWTQVVLNLLSNAVKYTHNGAVTVRLLDHGGHVELAVTDTGVGIPDHELAHVFDRFHRVAAADGRSAEGTGIGLSLVSDLVAAMRGEVAVTSTPGSGSTFTVTLPAPAVAATPTPGSSVQPAARPFTEEAQLWSAAPVPPARGRASATARVLLVEDNADMRAYLCRLLGEQGWAVDAVTDGAAALDSARLVRPDLVLADVMMPRMDGLALLRALRADPELSRVPVVLLSARAGTESAVDGLTHGADDYVVKPFAPAELVARVRVHLELSQLRELLLATERERGDQLIGALDTRGTIGQAVGILMARHACDADAAFELLIDLSQRRNRKLRDVAAELVGRANAAAATERVRRADIRRSAGR